MVQIILSFGENEKKERLIASLHSRLSNGIEVPLSDGKQIRDYLDVSVAAEQLTSVALGDRCGAVNICSGEGKNRPGNCIENCSNL